MVLEELSAYFIGQVYNFWGIIWRVRFCMGVQLEDLSRAHSDVDWETFLKSLHVADVMLSDTAVL